MWVNVKMVWVRQFSCCDPVWIWCRLNSSNNRYSDLFLKLVLIQSFQVLTFPCDRTFIERAPTMFQAKVKRVIVEWSEGGWSAYIEGHQWNDLGVAQHIEELPHVQWRKFKARMESQSASTGFIALVRRTKNRQWHDHHHYHHWQWSWWW